MRMSEQTYLQIRDILEKWYGLANDRATLQVLIEIAGLIDKEISARKTENSELRPAISSVVHDWFHSYASQWTNTEEETELVDDLVQAIYPQY